MRDGKVANSPDFSNPQMHLRPIGVGFPARRGVSFKSWQEAAVRIVIQVEKAQVVETARTPHVMMLQKLAVVGVSPTRR